MVIFGQERKNFRAKHLIFGYENLAPPPPTTTRIGPVRLYAWYRTKNLRAIIRFVILSAYYIELSHGRQRLVGHWLQLLDRRGRERVRGARLGQEWGPCLLLQQLLPRLVTWLLSIDSKNILTSFLAKDNLYFCRLELFRVGASEIRISLMYTTSTSARARTHTHTHILTVIYLCVLLLLWLWAYVPFVYKWSPCAFCVRIVYVYNLRELQPAEVVIFLLVCLFLQLLGIDTEDTFLRIPLCFLVCLDT